MTGGAILLPHKPVQVSPIMLPQLRQDMVLEQSVVSGSCHSLIPVALQPKSAILPDTTKYHDLGGVGWPVIGEMGRSASINRVTSLQWGISDNIFAVDMSRLLKNSLIRKQELKELLVSKSEDPSTEGLSSGKVCWLEKLPPHNFVRVISDVQFYPPPGRLIQPQHIPPGTAHRRDCGVSQLLGSIPVHHPLHQHSVSWSPVGSNPPTVTVPRAGLAVTVINCTLFHLFFQYLGHDILAWHPHTWELGLEVSQELVFEVPGTLMFMVLKGQKVSLLHSELRPRLGHPCFVLSLKKMFQIG